MPLISANNITLCYEEYGGKEAPVLLLIMGYGAQLIYWPPTFVQHLVAAGFRVIIYDNRDIGLSHKFDDVRAPHPIWQMLVKKLRPRRKLAPYNLQNMAGDAIGLLDALAIDKAHVLGVSMGGMIGQIVAADHADRVLSFTAVMTSTNAPGHPGPSKEVRRALFQSARAKTKTMEQAAVIGLEFATVIASEEGKSRPEERQALVDAALERSFYPAGSKRHMAAIIDNGDLRPWTRRITAPTLVIHGREDALIPYACGQDVAANIADADWALIDGMAHDLPASLIPAMAAQVAQHCHGADTSHMADAEQ